MQVSGVKATNRRRAMTPHIFDFKIIVSFAVADEEYPHCRYRYSSELGTGLISLRRYEFMWQSYEVPTAQSW